MKKMALVLVSAALASAFLLGSCASYMAWNARRVTEARAKEKIGMPYYVEPANIQETIDTGKLSSEAFDLSMLWMNKRFVSARNVIQYSNREAGMITGKAVEEVDGGGDIIEIWYTITIETKDNRARFSVQNINAVAKDGVKLNYTNKMQDQFSPLIRFLVKDFTSFVTSRSTAW